LIATFYFLTYYSVVVVHSNGGYEMSENHSFWHPPKYTRFLMGPNEY
jgi:hypothetical protein